MTSVPTQAEDALAQNQTHFEKARHMATLLGSGGGILSALGQYHEESGPHGGLADLAANARDARAKRWRLQGARVNGKEVVAISDDGPGPRMQGEDPDTARPSLAALQRMVKPGCSSSTDDSSKIGQAGVGTLTGSLVIGRSILFATHTETDIHLLLVSEPFTEVRTKQDCDAEVIKLSYDKNAEIWASDAGNAEPTTGAAAELLLQWSPFPSLEALHAMLLQLLRPAWGSLVLLIWDLHTGVKLSPPGAPFDLLLPPNEAHPQAYPTSARLFLSRTFPLAHRHGAHRADGRRFSIELGLVGKMTKAVEPMDPAVAIHNAPTEPLCYTYEGEQTAVARVWMGWVAEEEGGSCRSASRTVSNEPFGVVVVYNGQMVTFYEKSETHGIRTHVPEPTRACAHTSLRHISLSHGRQTAARVCTRFG